MVGTAVLNNHSMRFLFQSTDDNCEANNRSRRCVEQTVRLSPVCACVSTERPAAADARNRTAQSEPHCAPFYISHYLCLWPFSFNVFKYGTWRSTARWAIRRLRRVRMRADACGRGARTHRQSPTSRCSGYALSNTIYNNAYSRHLGMGRRLKIFCIMPTRRTTWTKWRMGQHDVDVVRPITCGQYTRHQSMHYRTVVAVTGNTMNKSSIETGIFWVSTK